MLLSQKRTSLSTATCLHQDHGHSWQHPSYIRCLTPYMASATQGPMQQWNWYHSYLCGLAWGRTVAPGHAHVCFAKFQKWQAHFGHMHIDLIRPLPSSSGCQYCLTTVNTYIHSPVRNNRGGSQKSFYILLDLPLRVPTSDHHGPRTTIWGTPLQDLGQYYWVLPSQDYGLAPCRKWYDRFQG